MKANKVHKRLAKIEAMISDLTERYSKGAVHIREALQDAKAAFAHVKEAVSSQTSSGTAKNPPVKRKKAAVKKAAAKAPIAKTAKKSVPIKKAAKKTTVKKAAPASVRKAPVQKDVPKASPPVQMAPVAVQVATGAAAQVPMGK